MPLLSRRPRLRRLALVVALGSAASCGLFGKVEVPPGSDGGTGVDLSRIKRIFVTSGRYRGDLAALSPGKTGLEAADDLCTQVARGALLEGTYKAWLSSAQSDAISRIADVGPWYQVSLVGEPPDVFAVKTFNNQAQLVSPPLEEIAVSETGAVLPLHSACVWTGSLSGGRRSQFNCADWTQASSITSPSGSYVTLGRWNSASATVGCTTECHLYCLEQ